MGNQVRNQDKMCKDWTTKLKGTFHLVAFPTSFDPVLRIPSVRHKTRRASLRARPFGKLVIPAKDHEFQRAYYGFQNVEILL